jgi:hypothetical protein
VRAFDTGPGQSRDAQGPTTALRPVPVVRLGVSESVAPKTDIKLKLMTRSVKVKHCDICAQERDFRLCFNRRSGLDQAGSTASDLSDSLFKRWLLEAAQPPSS